MTDDKNMNPAHNLIKRLSKKFTLKDVIHKSKFQRTQSNLFENISMYPSNGVGFHIRKVTWKQSRYMKIVKVDLQSNRRGRVWGIEFKDGKQLSLVPEEITTATTRGLWIYELGDSYAELDNGLIYGVNDMVEFYEVEGQREEIPIESLRANMDWDLKQQVEDIDEYYNKYYQGPEDEE